MPITAVSLSIPGPTAPGSRVRCTVAMTGFPTPAADRTNSRKLGPPMLMPRIYEGSSSDCRSRSSLKTEQGTSRSIGRLDRLRAYRPWVCLLHLWGGGNDEQADGRDLPEHPGADAADGDGSLHVCRFDAAGACRLADLCP